MSWILLPWKQFSSCHGYIKTTLLPKVDSCHAQNFNKSITYVIRVSYVWKLAFRWDSVLWEKTNILMIKYYTEVYQKITDRLIIKCVRFSNNYHWAVKILSLLLINVKLVLIYHTKLISLCENVTVGWLPKPLNYSCKAHLHKLIINALEA